MFRALPGKCVRPRSLGLRLCYRLEDLQSVNTEEVQEAARLSYTGFIFLLHLDIKFIFTRALVT